MTEIHTLDTIPQLSDFTPLSEHQQQTPATFFGGPPVLHYTLGECNLLVSGADLNKYYFLKIFNRATRLGGGVNGNTESSGAENGDDTEHAVNSSIENLVVIPNVMGYVTSESVVLFPSTNSASETSTKPSAVDIPYPSISLHATQRLLQSASMPHTYQSLAQATPSASYQETQALYIQLDPSNPDMRDAANDDDDEPEALELFLIPQMNNGQQVLELFEALSHCADLHPDTGELNPADEDSTYANGEMSEGGLGAVLAGLGGGQWITAENAHEFEGQFGVDEDEDEDEKEEVEDGMNDTHTETTALGPGAGTRRPREADAGDEDGNATLADGDDTKWQRTA